MVEDIVEQGTIDELILEVSISDIHRPRLNYSMAVYLEEAAEELATWSLQQFMSIAILIEVCCGRIDNIVNVPPPSRAVGSAGFCSGACFMHEQKHIDQGNR